MNTMETNPQVEQLDELDEQATVIDSEIVSPVSEEEIVEFIEQLLILRDKNTNKRYIVANDAAHKLIMKVLLKDNPFKARIEEIA
jgi:dTDP-4-dehydrorhamnose reductase